jgi:integrase
MSQVEKKQSWKTTAVPNLIRYVPSGVYYARGRVGGKLFYKTLETSTLSVAKLRLIDELKQRRAIVKSTDKVTSGRMTFADAVAAYQQKVEADPNLKPRSKDYRRTTINFIVKSWPRVMEQDVRKIARRDLEKWLSGYQQKYAPSVVNNSIGTLRAIFEIAVDAGLRFDNPAACLQRAKVVQKRLELPSRSQFERFVTEIDTAGARQSKDCANFVRFLAYTGLRKTEAKYVTWNDVDFVHGEILVRGDPITGTKNDEIRHVPIIPELRVMLEKLRHERESEPNETPVLRVNEAEKSMTRAARIIGMTRMRHHDLRHLFASTCIEAGVDIPTVSRWLGHKDGGALAMKVYGHLRREHSAAQALRVRFNSP